MDKSLVLSVENPSGSIVIPIHPLIHDSMDFKLNLLYEQTVNYSQL